jgi:hypothetical protein
MVICKLYIGGSQNPALGEFNMAALAGSLGNFSAGHQSQPLIKYFLPLNYQKEIVPYGR